MCNKNNIKNLENEIRSQISACVNELNILQELYEQLNISSNNLFESNIDFIDFVRDTLFDY